LVEIVFVVVIISIGLVSILYAINSAFDNVQSTKQRVIAINLAREGIE
jgi:type II secretory pathway pseudopilin PulG